MNLTRLLFVASPPPKRLILALTVLVLLCTAWLGSRWLDDDSLWYDEVFSLLDSGGSPYSVASWFDIAPGVASRNPWHAPGFFLLLHPWGRLVGWTEFAGRSLALLAGLLALAVTYRLGADLGGRRAGLAAAVLLGASGFYVHYLHELRAYTLIVLFAALATWAYWRLIYSCPRRWLYVTLIASLVALLYMHYFASLILVGLGLYHLLLAPRQRHWRLVLGLLVFSGLTFLPWTFVMLEAVQMMAEDSGRQRAALLPGEILRDTALYFTSGSIALAVAAGALVWLGLRRRRAALFLLVILSANLLLAIAVNVVIGVLANLRYLIAIWPLLAVLAGLGAGRLRLWLVVVIGAAAIVTGALASSDRTFSAPFHGRFWDMPWREISAVVREQAQPGDTLVTLLPSGVPAWMHRPVDDHYLYGTDVEARLIQSSRSVSNAQYRQAAEAAVEDVQRLWVAHARNRNTTRIDLFTSVLNGAFVDCEQAVTTEVVSVALYARSEALCGGIITGAPSGL